MEQRTTEWYEARKGIVTASRVGAILGNSPFAKYEDVMREMVRDYHGAEKEFQGNVATQWGQLHEHGAIIEYGFDNLVDVNSCGFVTKEDWAGCSPDGLVGEDGGIEVKCPYSKRNMQPGDSFKALSDQPHYVDQVQFSLWVTGRAWWDFVQWAPGGFMSVERVYPSPEWQNFNLPKLRAFHADYMDQREVNASVYIGDKHPKLADEYAADLVRRYDNLGAAIKRLEQERAAALQEIVTLAGEKQAEVAGRKLTHVEKKGAISYAKAIKELAPNADLEPWRGKPTSYWLLK